MTPAEAAVFYEEDEDPATFPGIAAERMTPPDPANVRLDPRLMTHDRLCELAGYKPVRFTVFPAQAPSLTLSGSIQSAVYIDCAEPGCGKGITQARATTGVQFMSDILRHWVNAHGVSLSGRQGDGAI